MCVSYDFITKDGIQGFSITVGLRAGYGSRREHGRRIFEHRGRATRATVVCSLRAAKATSLRHQDVTPYVASSPAPPGLPEAPGLSCRRDRQILPSPTNFLLQFETHSDVPRLGLR